jgi:hypothetical protein
MSAALLRSASSQARSLRDGVRHTLLAVAVICAVAACGDKTETPAPTDPAAQTGQTTTPVAPVASPVISAQVAAMSVDQLRDRRARRAGRAAHVRAGRQ